MHQRKSDEKHAPFVAEHREHAPEHLLVLRPFDLAVLVQHLDIEFGWSPNKRLELLKAIW
jgi:hypothetical protein